MIRLQAASLGYAVPRYDFNAKVHSVFPQAVNLRLENMSQLLTVVTAGCGDLPQGVRLKESTGFTFELWLRSGEMMMSRDSILEDEHHQISTDLRQAKHWECKLPVLGVNGVVPSVIAAWQSVWQALNARQMHGNIEFRMINLSNTDLPGQTALTRKLSMYIRDLVDAVRNLDPSASKSVAGLIGLGPGLTPGGDDFLVGFLTGLHCTTGHRAEQLMYLSEFGKMVVDLSRRTNDISRTYLFYAVRGQISSRLATLAQAITQGESSDRLLTVAEEAMRVGHSSGMEMVTGLMIGLSTWGNGFSPIQSMPVI